MAERLESFNQFLSKGPPTKYPWQEWCDGCIWKVIHGEDFFTKGGAKSFAQSLYHCARRNNKKVRVRLLDERTVIFQFYDKPEVTVLPAEVFDRLEKEIEEEIGEGDGRGT